MEFRSAVKLLRKELNLTQTELADALGVSFCTVNRWENGKGRASVSASAKILDFLAKNGVTDEIQNIIKTSLYEAKRNELQLAQSDLYSVERESICKIVDDAYTGVYVSDMYTNELLYVNRRAEEFFNRKFFKNDKVKCYEFVANRTTQCPSCPKAYLNMKNFTDEHIVSPVNGKNYHVRGKGIKWNGKEAHVEYINDETFSLYRQNGFMKLMDNVPAGICKLILLDNGRIEISYLNRGYYDMIGAKREERIQYTGFSAINAIYEKDRAAFVERIKNAAVNRAPFNMVFRLIKQNGELCIINIQGNFIESSEKKSTFYCVLTDVDNIIKSAGI